MSIYRMMSERCQMMSENDVKCLMSITQKPNQIVPKMLSLKIVNVKKAENRNTIGILLLRGILTVEFAEFCRHSARRARNHPDDVRGRYMQLLVDLGPQILIQQLLQLLVLALEIHLFPDLRICDLRFAIHFFQLT